MAPPPDFSLNMDLSSEIEVGLIQSGKGTFFERVVSIRFHVTSASTKYMAAQIHQN